MVCNAKSPGVIIKVAGKVKLAKRVTQAFVILDGRIYGLCFLGRFDS